VATHEIVEIIGSLVAALRTYASKLPTVSPISLVHSAITPTPDVVTVYEQAVLRFRKQAGAAPFRSINDLLVESLEAFEGGRLLGAIQPLLMALDHLDAMLQAKSLILLPAEVTRLQEYRATLNRILPGNQPELEGAGKGI
jgi:hypothetical protein